MNHLGGIVKDLDILDDNGGNLGQQDTTETIDKGDRDVLELNIEAVALERNARVLHCYLDSFRYTVSVFFRADKQRDE
jgi:hypothetical protein